MFCPMCGNELREGSVFCSKCGHQLGAVNGEARQTPVNVSAQPTPVAASVQKKPQTPRRNGVIIAAAVVAILAVVAVGLLAFSPSGKAASHPMPLNITAINYDAANDTRFPVEVKGTDADGAAVENLFFVGADGSGVELTPGSYVISFPASPLCKSGNFYTAPCTTVDVTVPDDMKPGDPVVSDAGPVQVTYSPKPIEKVTSEDIDKAYEYAKRDTENQQRADDNKAATTQVVAQAANAKKKDDLRARADAIEPAMRGDRRYGGSGREIGECLDDNANKFKQIAEEAVEILRATGNQDLLSKVDAAAAERENSIAVTSDPARYMNSASLMATSVPQGRFDAWKKFCYTVIDLIPQ